MSSIYVHSNRHHDVFELSTGGEKQVSISYNPTLCTARVDCKGSKRMFIIEQEGILLNRTILKNEYGVKIGQLGIEKWHSDRGYIDIDQERYFYKWQNNPLAEIIIYQDTPSKALLRCTLTTEKAATDIRFEKNNNVVNSSYQCLLMALCWYLFRPVAQESTLPFAV